MATTHREGQVIHHDGPTPPESTHIERPTGLRPEEPAAGPAPAEGAEQSQSGPEQTPAAPTTAPKRARKVAARKAKAAPKRKRR